MDYSKKTIKELVSICKEKGITGYSNKKKDDILIIMNTYTNSLSLPTISTSNVLSSITKQNKDEKSDEKSEEKSEEKLLSLTKLVNRSPLRYPGGKTRACSILEKYVKEYFQERKIILSPFFGGGSFELFMSSKGYTILANELFLPLFNFWVQKQNNCNILIEKIKEYLPISKEKFSEFRSKIMNEKDVLVMAAYYFIINRVSFSGATLSGGYSQQAADGRLTESSIERLKLCDVSNITFSNLDCNLFINKYPESDNMLIYADPPYYIEKYIYGKDGDMHENFNHKRLAETLLKRKDWILSYNDCNYIRELYKDCRIYSENWSYGMNSSKKSSEIIILPPIS